MCVYVVMTVLVVMGCRWHNRCQGLVWMVVDVKVCSVPCVHSVSNCLFRIEIWPAGLGATSGELRLCQGSEKSLQTQLKTHTTATERSELTELRLS